MDMFHQNAGDDDSLFGPIMDEPATIHDGLMRSSYDDLVKDLISEVKAYIRELHMIRKVKCKLLKLGMLSKTESCFFYRCSAINYIKSQR